MLLAWIPTKAARSQGSELNVRALHGERAWAWHRGDDWRWPCFLREDCPDLNGSKRSRHAADHRHRLAADTASRRRRLSAHRWHDVSIRSTRKLPAPRWTRTASVANELRQSI